MNDNVKVFTEWLQLVFFAWSNTMCPFNSSSNHSMIDYFDNSPERGSHFQGRFGKYISQLEY